MTAIDSRPQCRFGDGPAVGLFELPRGCIVYPDDREQLLCFYHAMRATPLGDIRLILDFTKPSIVD